MNHKFKVSFEFCGFDWLVKISDFIYAIETKMLMMILLLHEKNSTARNLAKKNSFQNFQKKNQHGIRKDLD